MKACYLFPPHGSITPLTSLSASEIHAEYSGASVAWFVYFFFHSHFFFIFCRWYKIFFLLYNIVLILPYINMNPPWVYMCSQSWTPPLPPPPPSLYHPSGSSQCTSPKHPVSWSNLDWWFVSYMILYMFQCHSPKSSHPLPLHRVQKTIYTSVSFLLSCLQGYC